ncbi:hypothetical protein MMC30_008847 [Trapelia coarctata]|nr:hypothetical protein [Trapelia coarctata]
MRTVVVKTVQGSIQAAILHSSLVCRRGVSTGSAIAKGIRKSRAGATREQYGSSRGAPRETAFGRDRSSTNDRTGRYPSARTSFDTGRKEKYAYPQDRSDNGGSGRENRERYNSSRDRLGNGRNGSDRDEVTRKPWQQGGREEQRNAFSDERRAPREDSYQQGGRRDDLPVRRSSSFETSERSGQRRYNDEPEDPYRSSMSRGAQSKSIWQSSTRGDASNNGNTASEPKNRAERRVAQFKETSMGGANSAYRDRKSPERGSSVYPRASDQERFEERRAARAAKLDYNGPSTVTDDFQSTEFAPRDSKPDRVDERRELRLISNSYEEAFADESADNLPRFDPERSKPRKRDTPLSIPYTTPASEFLYGTSVVFAALKSPRRKLYKLYMYDGEHREAKNMDGTVRKLALAQQVELFKVKSDWLPLMDKMSAGRPHNGYILEASPLPKLPATGLLPVDGYNRSLEVSLDHQSREDELVNGTNPVIKYKTAFPRYPFVLMLDGILDPGNLGAILRTAHFLSVDAVAFSARHSAPLTPTALKASAGASESLPLISIPHPGAFVDACKAAGWKFYAAVAPPSAPLHTNSDTPLSETRRAAKPDNSGSKSKANEDGRASFRGTPPPHFTLASVADDSPLLAHPTVLMLGSEGEGLRWNLEKKADATVSIEGGWRLLGDMGGKVDSLNVSVAAGLLVEGFLRRPAAAREGRVNEKEKVDAGVDADADGDAVEEGRKVAARGDLF